MYSQVIEQITGGDRQVVVQAIEEAIEEVRSYLRPRYDTQKVFAAEGTKRNAQILGNTKVVAVWNLIKLSNAETIYEMWRDRYDRVVKYLVHVSNGGPAPDLPLLTDGNGNVKLKARFGSNPKFNHEL